MTLGLRCCCLLFLAAVGVSGSLVHNITCYQCKRFTNEECGQESLKVCPSNKDRCVTHISKDATNGYVLKRECGLGPCGFEDEMMNRGLGLEGCDQSKDEFFCISCCREDGCNKAAAGNVQPVRWMLLATTGLVFTLNCIGHFFAQLHGLGAHFVHVTHW